ncbi:MAG: hypothetical protein AAGI90_02700 [Chlamydiota bacterium]
MIVSRVTPVRPTESIKNFQYWYWERFWRQSRALFFRSIVLIQEGANTLYENITVVAFFFFRTLTYILPPWLAYRLEAAVGYMCSYSLKQQEERRERLHQAAISQIERACKEKAQRITKQTEVIEEENSHLRQQVATSREAHTAIEAENEELEREIEALSRTKEEKQQQHEQLQQQIAQVQAAILEWRRFHGQNQPAHLFSLAVSQEAFPPNRQTVGVF